MRTFTCLHCKTSHNTIHAHQKYCKAIECQRARKRNVATARKKAKKEIKPEIKVTDINEIKIKVTYINEINMLKTKIEKLEKANTDLIEVASFKKMNDKIDRLINVIKKQQKEIDKFYNIYSFDKETGNI